MNPLLSNTITRIDRDYSDPGIYATAYAEYLANQTEIMQEIANGIMHATAAVRPDGTDIDYSYVVDNLNQRVPDVNTEDVVVGKNVASMIPNQISSIPTIQGDHTVEDEVINELMPIWNKSVLSSSDGAMLPVSEVVKAAMLNASGYMDDALQSIANSKGKLTSLNSALSDIKEQIQQQLCITTTFELLAEQAKTGMETTLSDFYSALNLKSADLSKAGIVSSLKGYVLSSFGDVKGRVFGLTEAITNSGQESADGIDGTTGYIPSTMDLSGYTGVSAATVSGVLNAGPFKTAVKSITTVVKGAIGAVVGVLKAGFSLVKKVAKKYIAPAVSNPVFTQNSDWQVESVDQPIFCGYCYRKDWDYTMLGREITFSPGIYDGGYLDGNSTDWKAPLMSLDNLVKNMAGNVTVQDYLDAAYTLFGNTDVKYALHMRYMFFDLYFSFIPAASLPEQDRGDAIYVEVYPIPTKWDNLPDKYWTIIRDLSTDTDVIRDLTNLQGQYSPLSLQELADTLFPSDPSEIYVEAEDISGTTGNDVNMVRCCIASAYRTMVYCTLRTLVNLYDSNGRYLYYTVDDANNNVRTKVYDIGDRLYQMKQILETNEEFRPGSLVIPRSYIAYDAATMANTTVSTAMPMVLDEYNQFSAVPVSERIQVYDSLFASQSESSSPARPAPWAWFCLKSRISNISASVVNTSYWQFCSESAKPNGTHVFYSTGIGQPASLSTSFYYIITSMLFAIQSNKLEYMRNKYLNSDVADFPLFIPYERTSSRLTPRYHIQSDAQIKAKADAIVTAAVTAVIALLVTAAAAYLGFKVRKTVKNVLAKQSNLAEAYRYEYQDMLLASQQGDQVQLKTVEKIVDGKTVTETVEEVIHAPTKKELNQKFMQFRRTQKRSNRISKLADILGCKDWTGYYDIGGGSDTINDNIADSTDFNQQIIYQTLTGTSWI